MILPLSDEERKKRKKESNKKWYKKNRKKIIKKARKWDVENPKKAKERKQKWQEENREKTRESERKYRGKNPKKEKERKRKYREEHPEIHRKWQKENPELIKAYKKKYREKNPTAHTKEMTKYRRSHRKCEWSSCGHHSVYVHHILSQYKYPKYKDGNYHGRVGNNFICYCPFHHFAYHYTYSTKRNNKKHQKALSFLWYGVEQWANANKISIEDLEIELDQMYPSKVILS